MWNPARNTVSTAIADDQEPNGHNILPMAGRPVPSVPHTAIIGKTIVIKGEVSGAEPLQIEGRVEGSIAFSGNYVSIGRDGVVTANVKAQDVAIRGMLRGNLNISDRVEIHGGGSVIGDISTRRIGIEDGAHFRGSIDMRRPDPKEYVKPASDAAELAKPVSDTETANPDSCQ